MSSKAKIREEVRKLVPIDDVLFSKLAEDKLFCQEILRVIMQDPQLEVLDNTPQYDITNLQGRSVILDAHCRLCDGRDLDIEVQKSNNDNHQKRVRYNGAVLTANIMEPGERFDRVPSICVVFISRFDIFKDGETIYHVDRVIRETGRTVYNGFEEIYVNTEVNDGSEISELMDVFVNDGSYSDKFPLTSAGKYRYKETEEGQDVMCDIVEKIREEGREEGLEQGREEGLEKGLEQGRVQGREEGRVEGINDVNALTFRLINENRLDDLRRAATDIVYQAQLFNELFPQGVN